MNYIISTPFIPPGFEGKVEVKTISLTLVREMASHKDVISYCGHQASADWLGVPMFRGELKASDLQVGTELIGVRPLRRPNPGEELEFTPENFQGFILTILEVS